MPPRPSISALPPETRAELERRLVTSGFSDYSALAAWLNEQGYEISRSAVHRFGQTFEERVRALQMVSHQAKAIVDATPDDQGSINEAMLRLTQEKVFGILMELEIDVSTVDITKLTRSVADLARANVSQAKFRQEVLKRAEAAAEDVEKVARKGGLTDEAAAAIRQKILGIAA